MSDSAGWTPSPLEAPGGLRLCLAGIRADGSGAAHGRGEFARWLQRHFVLSQERYSDMVLAVYEALANAAEHAYADRSRAGSVVMDASYYIEEHTLAVVIADGGGWRPPHCDTTGGPTQRRGRGIPLIHALTDGANVETAETGTNVILVWNEVTRSPRRDT